MTQLNWKESALLLTSLAKDELRNHQHELAAQLAYIRLEKAEAALRGIVDLEEFEKKLLGVKSET